MNKSESKYYNTSARMDEAFIQLLNQKPFEYITVKEICETSGVNRSTFYLHYETVGDLLLETAEYIGNKFSVYFAETVVNQEFIQTAPREELIFITSDFLIPWLSFIKENKAVYRAVLKRFDSLSLGEDMYKSVLQAIDKVMERFAIPAEDRPFMIRFYLEGLNAIVKEWLDQDCERSIEDMVQIIKDCVRAR